MSDKKGRADTQQIAHHARTIIQVGRDYIQQNVPLKQLLFIGGGIFLLLVVLLAENYLSARRLYRDIFCGNRQSPDMRISIAGFALDDKTSLISKAEISGWNQSLAQRLEQVLSNDDSGIIIQVWDTRCAGSIQGNTPDEWLQSAQQIAESTRSSIVVYGSIHPVSSTEVIVQPYFYLFLQNAYDAKEILGPYTLGAPFSIVSLDPTTRQVAVGKYMLPRISLLAKISTGLTYFSVQDYCKSRDILKLAYSQTSVPEEQILALVLAGNAAGRINSQDGSYSNLDEAANFYQQALQIDPEYARAYIGLGGIY